MVVLFLLFLLLFKIIFISIWAIHSKMVNLVVITLPLLPFPNNTNFKDVSAASCFHCEDPSSAPPEFTFGEN